MIRRFIHQYGSELLYHLGAPIYDWAEPILFSDAWEWWRDAAVALTPRSAMTILDLGAGTGAMTRAFLRARITARIIAVEPSRPMIGTRTKRPYGETVLRAEASHLPLRGDSVDAVVVGFPGPYIWDSATWDELARVLHSHGVVVALVGGRLDPAMSRSLLGRLIGFAVYGNTSQSRNNERSTPSMPPLVNHPSFLGYWRALLTERGTCYVWMACRRT